MLPAAQKWYLGYSTNWKLTTIYPLKCTKILYYFSFCPPQVKKEKEISRKNSTKFIDIHSNKKYFFFGVKIKLKGLGAID